jgi:DNA-binding HxlR family transcriptional regulator
MPKTLGKEAACSIARGADLLGDSWTLLIVREAMLSGSTRFQEFRDALGVAPNILSKRLATLVEEGVLERRSYQESGSRPREEYVLTEAGHALSLVIAALGAWGDAYRPRPDSTLPWFTRAETGEQARLAFVTDDGVEVPPEQLLAHPASEREAPATR